MRMKDNYVFYKRILGLAFFMVYNKEEVRWT